MFHATDYANFADPVRLVLFSVEIVLRFQCFNHSYHNIRRLGHLYQTVEYLVAFRRLVGQLYSKVPIENFDWLFYF